MEFLVIGTTPADEPTVQVGWPDSLKWGKIEGEVFIEQLKRMHQKEIESNPDLGHRFKVKTFSHDFGAYPEVIISYCEDDEGEEDFAFVVEGSIPEHWDEEAKTKLESLGYFDYLKRKGESL